MTTFYFRIASATGNFSGSPIGILESENYETAHLEIAHRYGIRVHQVECSIHPFKR